MTENNTLGTLDAVLQETEISPFLVAMIIRGIYNIQNGTGYGKVVIDIINREVRQVESTEKDRL